MKEFIFQSDKDKILIAINAETSTEAYIALIRRDSTTSYSFIGALGAIIDIDQLDLIHTSRLKEFIHVDDVMNKAKEAIELPAPKAKSNYFYYTRYAVVIKADVYRTNKDYHDFETEYVFIDCYILQSIVNNLSDIHKSLKRLITKHYDNDKTIKVIDLVYAKARGTYKTINQVHTIVVAYTWMTGSNSDLNQLGKVTLLDNGIRQSDAIRNAAFERVEPKSKSKF